MFVIPSVAEEYPILLRSSQNDIKVEVLISINKSSYILL